MNEFAKTRTGQKFFNKDLPDLVNAINRLADIMQEKD